MPQESGSVTSSLEARISIHLVAGEAVECVVDTGFDGALMLSRDLVDALGLPVLGTEEIELVGDIRAWADISLVAVRWLGEERDAHILVSDGHDSLIGTELLRGTQLIINYAKSTVSITK